MNVTQWKQLLYNAVSETTFFSNTTMQLTFFYFCTVTSRVWDDAFDGQVRLQNGVYTSEGTVEIYCNNEWGTLCNTGFDNDDANVVCEQLGYSDGTNSAV